MNDAMHEMVEDARMILEFFGFDAERSNERSALVLLALARLRPNDRWCDATSPMVGTRRIMDWIRNHYGVAYAPNTRETIRRFTLHQFGEAMLVQQNPDDPRRPINSPKWCYQIHPRALDVIRSYRTDDFNQLVEAYLADVPSLRVRYEAARQMQRIPVILPNGGHLTLSPGGQNVLLKQMVEDFCGYFAPGAHVLYVGDADDKWAIFERQGLESVGVSVNEHGKMPDLVVHRRAENWLVLLEAATSHGPVDAKRYAELRSLFSSSTAGLVFVSCFQSRAVMRKYLANIAWETEVWCADNPTHIIHFDGERFLGPYST